MEQNEMKVMPGTDCKGSGYFTISDNVQIRTTFLSQRPSLAKIGGAMVEGLREHVSDS
jgi:hypothetical protein